MRVLVTIACVVACIAAAGCGGGTTHREAYPKREVAAFIAQCSRGYSKRFTRRQATAACTCFIKKMEANVPVEDFHAYARQLARGQHPTPPKQMTADARACAPSNG